jgi:hypothetical protein
VLLRPSLQVGHLLAHLLPGVIFCGDRQRRELALTIDDGPSPGSDGSSHTGSMALLAFPPGLRSGRCPAPKRSGAVHAAAALVPARRWLDPALDAPQRRDQFALGSPLAIGQQRGYRFVSLDRLLNA